MSIDCRTSAAVDARTHLGHATMLRYQSRRHRLLMDESEQALCAAAEKPSGADARIAKQILGDAKSHGLWEARHAELVRPVAEQTGRVPQVLALRDVELRLIHRRALFDHIREHEIRGPARERLFRVFYGTRDLQNAILAEHRQYMLAVSSRVSADHLINVMRDPAGKLLLEHYQSLHAQYFSLYCHVSTAEDRTSADATKVLMINARRKAANLRRRFSSIGPDQGTADFEQQALLARSGRYPALSYFGASDRPVTPP